MAKVVDFKKAKFKKEQEHLKKVMLERYGSIEAEWEAFLMCNQEGIYSEKGYSTSLYELAEGLHKAHTS